MINYETLKEASKEVRRQTKTKCNVEDLIALARGNDPFYFGTDADLEMGEWFAEIWKKFNYVDGVHLRRIHYQIVSQTPALLLPGGLPYENTEACWRKLEEASKRARYLDFVPAEAFVDRRNREHQIFAKTTQPPALKFEVNHNLSSSIDLDFPSFPDLPSIDLQRHVVNGMWKSGWEGVQSYLVELWAEKSTMDDILLPLCQRYECNYVVSLGEQSITSALNLVKRAQAAKKPVRIFYISDFDPAGASMPVATARKIEFYVRKYAPDIDIQVFPLALTAEQCATYQLPRTPIKDGERRKERFEERHGEGATELDALQALHPGALSRIVKDAILTYYDPTLAERVRQEGERMGNILTELQGDAQAMFGDEVERLRAEYEAIVEDAKTKLSAVYANIETVWQGISEYLEVNVPEIADFPIPTAEISGEEFAEGLYHSRRDYFAQMAAYKAFQGKPFERLANISLN